MRWQKQETCESIADVWKDVGHLVSQKYDTDMDLIHNLSLVKIYFKSNLLDGILYEWRYIEKSGLLPPTAQTTKYISLDAEGQNISLIYGFFRNTINRLSQFCEVIQLIFTPDRIS